jgi:hypothetical protein
MRDSTIRETGRPRHAAWAKGITRPFILII